MRFLVTGAQGCIGSWVLLRLLERGADVVALDMGSDLARLRLLTGESAWPGIRTVSGDITDTAAIRNLIAGESITHVIHLAAVLMPFCQANPVQGAMINVIGTLNVFQAARDAGRNIRVVYASSSAVWGPEDIYPDRPLREADSVEPRTHYGVFKHANEGNARIFFQNEGISSIGLRPWTVYGAGRDHGLTADPTLAMKAVALGQDFQIRVSGSMDLQYVEDVAETFVLCALSTHAGAHVFNLAGSIVAMDGLVEMLARLRPSSRGRITVSGAPVPVCCRMDASALHQAIPGIPDTPLEQGVEETIRRFESMKAVL
jgi:nucleoside-diphosphate-sugar epimerase